MEPFLYIKYGVCEMAKKKEKEEVPVGRIDYRSLINKKAGGTAAYNLKEKNPTEVKEWIPTGSKWLDASICLGRMAGIPVGKITKIAGLSSTGKSLLALIIAKNAQKMGIKVFYFDSEAAMDPDFAVKIGVDLDEMVYIQAESTEMVLETIEMLIANDDTRKLFIWDSLANTPCKAELESDFNPSSHVGLKPRILSQGFKKLTDAIANADNTLLLLNQLKTKIPKDHFEAMANLSDPWFEPGGLAPGYQASLSIRLVTRKSKSGYVVDDKGYRIGSEVKAIINKSRFGTDGRQCTFNIIFRDDPVGIRDEESWFEAIIGSDRVQSPSKGWYQLEDGRKFRESQWSEMMKDPSFKETISKILEEEHITKFAARSGNAVATYDIDDRLEELQNNEEDSDN